MQKLNVSQFAEDELFVLNIERRENGEPLLALIHKHEQVLYVDAIAISPGENLRMFFGDDVTEFPRTLHAPFNVVTIPDDITVMSLPAEPLDKTIDAFIECCLRYEMDDREAFVFGQRMETITGAEKQLKRLYKELEWEEVAGDFHSEVESW